uniref:Reverse transcriptase domain-containing protein n=1 Tax=Caenorhabditis japonica TaxID=281687 RepID=A0A8R1IP08_CAEJA
MHGFTADIKKCFSSVDHNILMDTLTSIMKETVYYTIQGSGFGDKNRWRMYCCTGKTENEAKSKLEEKLRTLKRTERKCVQPIKRDILLEELQTIISSYHFKRGKTTLKVTRGVPQGHPVSSNFSHVYLSKFEDFYWRNELKNEENSMVYCRYEDDYVFFAKEKATVEKPV